MINQDLIQEEEILVPNRNFKLRNPHCFWTAMSAVGFTEQFRASMRTNFVIRQASDSEVLDDIEAFMGFFLEEWIKKAAKINRDIRPFSVFFRDERFMGNARQYLEVNYPEVQADDWTFELLMSSTRRRLKAFTRFKRHGHAELLRDDPYL